MAERKRTKKHCINDGKNRDVCSDPERKRQDGDKCKSGRFAELPKREFQIVHITRYVTPESDQRVRLAAPGPGMRSMRSPRAKPLKRQAAQDCATKLRKAAM